MKKQQHNYEIARVYIKKVEGSEVVEWVSDDSSARYHI